MECIGFIFCIPTFDLRMVPPTSAGRRRGRPKSGERRVQAVFIGSPADKAGVRPDDVISEFGGKTIPDAKTFNDLLAQYSPGQRVQFRAWRDGRPEYFVARLGEAMTVASR